ncbi:MAG: AccI family restriction endonuclease [Verrucomicrobiales bacterium]|nr:AccI family restriction endonuclease [Verrucomicrobiales bacterium]
MTGEEYFVRLKQTLEGVVANLRAKGIHERHLSFGGEGAVPTRKPTVPSDARSEFLANRAMGDWAEQRLADAVIRACPAWKVSQYGDTNRIAAGHPDFKATYLAGLEHTRQFGKRPDLLLFPANAPIAADLSSLSYSECDPLLKQAIAAIEVRSSKFEALTYIAVRKRQRDAGKTSARETPSFTVKVEDLVIVYRWLERHHVPESYCQVFFDSVFAINFLDIFAIVASGSGFTIETPEKSQEKATIMIPITSGTQIGRATSMPTFAAEHRVTELGRHDAFVVPQGGGFALDPAATRKILLAEG